MNHTAKKIYQNSLTLRGIVLDAVVDIERAMDNYIANYFCIDEHRSNELREMLLHTERITLGSKKDVYYLLIRRYNPEYIELNPKFIETLERFIPHRNVLAHLEVDYSEKWLNKENIHVAFKKYKEGKLKDWYYTQDDVDKLKTDYHTIMKHINAIKPPGPPQNQ
jgi:hypothetical protein